MGANGFLIDPMPPFRLDLTAWALRRRPHNEVDRWDGETYRRCLALDPDLVIDIAVTQIAPLEKPRLDVAVEGATIDARLKTVLHRTLNELLGITVDLRRFYALAKNDRQLAALIEPFRGLKPPRFPSLFEGLVNGIACQQVSLTVGITLLNRLAARFGARHVNAHAFPNPKDLADRDPAVLRGLGFSGQKVRALLELARGTNEGNIPLENLAKLDPETAKQNLLNLHGVGRWTAEYLLLRGLGRLDVFPGDDAGARTRLARWLKRSEPFNYEAVARAVQRWQPFAGMVYFHLLLNSLAETGILTNIDSHESHLQ